MKLQGQLGRTSHNRVKLLLNRDKIVPCDTEGSAELRGTRVRFLAPLWVEGLTEPALSDPLLIS